MGGALQRKGIKFQVSERNLDFSVALIVKSWVKSVTFASGAVSPPALLVFSFFSSFPFSGFSDVESKLSINPESEIIL